LNSKFGGPKIWRWKIEKLIWRGDKNLDHWKNEKLKFQIWGPKIWRWKIEKNLDHWKNEKLKMEKNCRRAKIEIEILWGAKIEN
jgi:hypothetical protein